MKQSKISLKVISLITLVMMLFVLITGCTSNSGTTDKEETQSKSNKSGGKQFVSIGTSSVGGTYSIIGTGLADVINKNVEGLKANIEITGGSSENVVLVSNGNIEFGMSAADAIYFAYNGKSGFKDNKITNIRGVMGGHNTVLQVYTLADSGIESFKDLKGKKIAVGSPGSIGNGITELIMNEYGFAIDKDWKPEFISHSAGSEALQDGNVDAVVIISTVPTPPITNAATAKDIRLLSLDRDILDKILKDNPYWIESSVTGGVYRGIDKEVNNLFAVPAVLITSPDVSEELVYNVTKALMENNKALVDVHPAGKEWSIDNATRGLEGIIPMHPGAIKYLKEKGVYKE